MKRGRGFSIFLGLILFGINFVVLVNAAQNPNYPSPYQCGGDDWNIGAPDGGTCKGSVTTIGALEDDPKATAIFGIDSRVKPELVTMNKFCQDYTKEVNSYATYGRMHNYCNGCDQRLAWWANNKWNVQDVCYGTLNVQIVKCGTNCCTPNCAGKTCGGNGCGGSCGTCSGANSKCNPSGNCVQCLADADCSGGLVCNAASGQCYNPKVIHTCINQNQTIIKIYDWNSSIGGLYNGALTYDICFNDIFGYNYIKDIHTCNENNSVILYLNSSDNAYASTYNTSKYNVPVCFGNVTCRTVYKKMDVNDNFDAAEVNSTKWDQVNPANPAVIVDGKLRTVGSLGDMDDSLSGVTSFGKWNLSGDFDIQVDYDSTAQPIGNSSVTTYLAVTGRYFYGLSSARLNNGSFWTYGWTNQTKTFWWLNDGKNVTARSSGKFRIKRAGSTMSGYQFENNAWVKIAEISGCDTSDMKVNLMVNNNIASVTGKNPIKIPNATFDNFIVNKNSFSDSGCAEDEKLTLRLSGETDALISNASDSNFPLQICCKEKDVSPPMFSNVTWQDMLGNNITTADVNDTVKMVVFRQDLLLKNVNYQVFKERTCSLSDPLDCVLQFFGDVRIAQEQSRGYRTIRINETGNYYFTAKAEDSTDVATSNMLSITSPQVNNVPAISIVRPIEESRFVVWNNGKTDAISFEQNATDKDDDLSVTWDFNDGYMIKKENCLTGGNCNATYSYNGSAAGTRMITAEAKESTRYNPQSEYDIKRIYVYKPGLVLFPIIDSPDYRIKVFNPGTVRFDGTSTHVANCTYSLSECNLPGKGSGSCFTINNGPNISCYKFAESATDSGFIFEWTIDGDVDTDHTTPAPFERLFPYGGRHEIRLKVTYTY